MAPKYNVIYDELVEDENDIVGLLAYGIYKRKKILFIRQILEENGGEDPSDEIIENFHKTSLQHKDGYRLKAETLSYYYGLEFNNEYIEQVNAEIDQIVEDYQTELDYELGIKKAEIERDKEDNRIKYQNKTDELNLNSFKSFSFGVLQSLAATFLFLLGIGLTVFIIEAYQIDLLKPIKDVVNTESKQEMLFDGNVYWMQNKEGEKIGPYCPICYDVRSRFVRLHTDNNSWLCYSCDLSLDKKSNTSDQTQHK